MQITLYEQLTNGSFQEHELFRTPSLSQRIDIEVVDWDGDGALDLLVCTELAGWVNVSLLAHSVMPVLGSKGADLLKNLVHLNHSSCEIHALLAVDFDEDGDVDLFLGRRYFERIFSNLIERVGRQNPIGIFNGKVELIADMDGDGRVELLVEGWQKGADAPSQSSYLRYFRRAMDGSFVEPTTSLRRICFLLGLEHVAEKSVSFIRLHTAKEPFC